MSKRQNLNISIISNNSKMIERKKKEETLNDDEGIFLSNQIYNN